MDQDNSGVEDVNKSNVAFWGSLDQNDQSSNEFQFTEVNSEQLENNYFIPYTDIPLFENDTFSYYSSLNQVYLDDNIVVPNFECYNGGDESKEDIKDDGKDVEKEEEDDDESVNLEKYGEDEDELMLRQTRKLIDKTRNMKEFFTYMKNKLYAWYEITKDENFQNQESCEQPRLCNDFWYRFNTPYFKDRYLFSCGPNADTKYRQKHGLEQTTLLVRNKRNRWMISDTKILSDLIKEELIKKETECLISAERRLKRKKVNIGKTKTCEVKDKPKKLVLNKGKMKMDNESGELKQNKLYKDEDKIEIDEIINKIKSKNLTELMIGKDNWDFDWEKISIIGFNNKYSSNECAQYWHLYLKPSINKELWSKDEDNYLIKLVTKYKRQNWEKISEELGTNRSPFQVFKHYFGELCKNLCKSKGDNLPLIDDKELAKIVKSCSIDGKIEWHSVSYITGRPIKQLYYQWWYSSHPEMIKGNFTKEEDMIILTGFQKFGYNSKMLSTILKHRYQSQILSRYKSLIPDGKGRGPWELHEDELLLKLVEEYGFGEWSKIANKFPTRNRTQIRQRYNILQQKMKQDKNFNIAQLKRNKCRQIVDKSANVDKLVGKAMKKLKKVDLPLDKRPIQIEQIDKLKTDLFPKATFQHLTESNMADRKFIDHFFGNCPTCKKIRKCDVKNISNVADSMLYCFVYLNVITLKTITKAKIKKNDDKISDLLRNVLHELMQEDVFDLHLATQKLLKLECPDEMIVDNDLAEWEIDNSILSTSKQVVNKKTRNYIFYVNPNSIDCLPVKREDSLVDLKEQWLYSEINFKDVKISQLIKRKLDEFSFGVYNFIKKDSDCTSQTMTDLTPFYSISFDTTLPETNTQPLQNCNSNLYKLPVNLSSILFLRMLEISKIKSENTLKNENINIQDLNDLTYIILQQQDNPSVVPEKINFNEKNNDPIMELPSTKLLIKMICNVLHWTILTTKLPLDCVNQPTRRRKSKRIEEQNKLKNLKETRVKKTCREKKTI